SAETRAAAPLPKPKPAVERDDLDAPLPRPKPDVARPVKEPPVGEPERKTVEGPVRMSALPPHVEAEVKPAKPTPILRSDACLDALKAEGVEAVRAASPSDKPW